MSLFNSIIFGPVKSRRLGTSLGINLLPAHIKFCTFNCIYCECGWTEASDIATADFFAPEVIAEALEKRLSFLKENQVKLDSITFAGNGEPTMHPKFPEIITDTIRLRDKYAPHAKISVLSNSTMITNDAVREALMKVNNIMKLDAGSEEVFRSINNPRAHISLEEIIENLKKFEGKLTIQSMFVRGEIGHKKIDNTEATELDKWLSHLGSYTARRSDDLFARPPPAYGETGEDSRA